MTKHKSQHARAFTLIEVVLGIGILTMFFVVSSFYFKQALVVSQQTTNYIQAGFLLEEGVEAVKLLRDTGWTANIATLTNGTTYYLHWTGAGWVTTTTPEEVENVFTRTITLASVSRDAGDSITASGGVVDLGTRKVVVSVSWTTKNGVLSTKSIETYITNLFNN